MNNPEQPRSPEELEKMGIKPEDLRTAGWLEKLYANISQEHITPDQLSEIVETSHPFLQLGKYSREYPDDLAEKIRTIDRHQPLPQYIAQVLESIGQEFDPEKLPVHEAQSFQESRFVTTREILQKRLSSCGSMSNIAASVLRHEGIPTKLVHGYVREKRDEDRHAWIEVYFPSLEKWIPFDPTNTFGYLISEDHVKMREYIDWEQLEEDYQKGEF